MCVICSRSKYVLINVMHICVVEVIVEVYALFNKMPPCMKCTYMGGCVCMLIEDCREEKEVEKELGCFSCFWIVIRSELDACKMIRLYA
jgi:hypothetical protein